MKRIITSLFLVSSFGLSNAQTAFETAGYLYQDKNYTDAAKAYTKFAEKTQRDDAKAEAYARIGNCYYYTQNNAQAELWYKKAVDAGYASSELFMNYGDVRMSNGDYPSAIRFYEKAKNMDNAVEVLANTKIQACLSAQERSERPSMLQHKNEDGLNTKYNDFGMAMFGNKFMLSSARKMADTTTDKKSGQGHSAIYTATKNGSTWQIQAPSDSMFKAFNTGNFVYHEASQTAYFTICGEGDNKTGTCKIYAATYNGTWSKPEALNFNSEEYNCAQPAITADGKTLYFSSDKTGGLGAKDLYKVSKGTTGTWMEPVNLGKDINTAGDEVFPVMSGDTLLVYSTNGNGIGGLDLFKATVRKGVVRKSSWMDIPFNSSSDDFNLVYGKSSMEGFYCSNRSGGMGGDDIYSFSIDQNLYGMGGDVRDEVSKKGLSGAAIVITGTDGSKAEITSDDNGVFAMPQASPFVGYTIEVSKKGYFSKIHTIPAIQLGDDADQKVKERNNTMLSLSTLPAEEEERKLDNIYFEYNSADLTNSSKTELLQLVKLLKENPKVEMTINSHSDEQGEVQYNLELSHKRAQSVVEFLINNGVSRDRLVAKGWGESNPMVKNANSEEGHAANRRTTFKVTNL